MNSPSQSNLAAAVQSSTSLGDARDDGELSLTFFTQHPTKPTFVDLRVFRDGSSSYESRGQFTVDFTGRPKLILQLAPIFRALYEGLAALSVATGKQALRAWWRILDEVDNQIELANPHGFDRVDSVEAISELHRIAAFDAGLDSTRFLVLPRLINSYRSSVGQRPLYWDTPERSDPARHLAPKWAFDQMRRSIKRLWYAACDRWQLCDDLLSGGPPNTLEEKQLLENYTRLEATIMRCGTPRPTGREIYGDLSVPVFYRTFNVELMFKGFFPDGNDARAAFFLTLTGTGWNPGTVVDIDAEAFHSTLLRTNPKDPYRYTFSAFKERGQSEPTIDGLYKSCSSPGMVVQAYLKRTEPIRTHLRRLLSIEKERLTFLETNLADPRELIKCKQQIHRFESGIRSVWLFVSARRDGILWLNNANYHGQREKGESFLENVATTINSGAAEGNKLPRIVASDFRDAFAAYAYNLSGGFILYVKRILNHRHLSSSQKYIDNNINNEQADLDFRNVMNNAFAEIEDRGVLDVTVVAKLSRDGAITPAERERLYEYRGLAKSRMAIGCENPWNPPKRIDPSFQANGPSACSKQRCTLCYENAVILPESLDGLAMRLAELRWLKERMSISAYFESSFEEELRNTVSAMSLFPEQNRTNRLSFWEREISEGRHHPIQFEGV